MADLEWGVRRALALLLVSIALLNVVERDWLFAALCGLAAAGQFLPAGWLGWVGVLRVLLVATLLVLAGLSLQALFTD